jgi:hypothetical protein
VVCNDRFGCDERIECRLGEFARLVLEAPRERD